MTETIKERILWFIEFNHISVLKFEKSIGASNGYIRNTKNFSAEIVASVLRAYPDLSPDWLLNGQGEMLRDERPVFTQEMYEALIEVVGDVAAEGLLIGNMSIFRSSIVSKNNERINSLVDTIATLQQALNEKSQTVALLSEQLKKLENTK